MVRSCTDAAPSVEATGQKDGNAYVGYVKVRLAAKPASGSEEVQLVYDLSFSRRAQLACPEEISGPTSVSLTIGRSATLRFAECRKEDRFSSAKLSKEGTEKFTVVKKSYVEFFLTISSNNVSGVAWFDAGVRIIVENSIANELRIDRGRVQFISAQTYTPAATRRAGSYSALVHGLASSDEEAKSLGLRAKDALMSIQAALGNALNASVTVTTEVKGTSDMPIELLIGLGAGGGVLLLAVGWYMSRASKVGNPQSAPIQQQANGNTASQDVKVSSSLELSSNANERSTAPAMQTIKVRMLTCPGLFAVACMHAVFTAFSHGLSCTFGSSRHQVGKGFDPHSYQDKSQRGGSALPTAQSGPLTSGRLPSGSNVQAQGATRSLQALQAAAQGKGYTV